MTEFFDSQAYLARIGLEQAPAANLSGLQQLHRAHFFNIPFENFDIPLGRGIQVDAKAIFNKLVHQRRGGYCFEVNGLLQQALTAYGFQARPLLARVHLSGSPSDRSHQLSLVSIAQQDWLVDTGFGSQTPRHPLPLTLDEALTTDIQTYRLVNDEQFGTMLQLKNQHTWDNLYSFDFNHVCQGDIDYANHCTSTMPTSTFTNVWMAALPNPTGITTLLNDSLRVTTNGATVVTELAADKTYIEVLKQHFHIDLKANYEHLKAFNKDFL